MPVLTTVAEVKSQVGKEAEVKKRLTALLQPVREEKGCISFDLHASHYDNSLFVLIAVWESYEAWRTHIDSPRQRALLEESKTERAHELVDYWSSYQIDKLS